MSVSRRRLIIGGSYVIASGAMASLPSCRRSNTDSGTVIRKAGFVPPDSIPVAKRPQELTYLAKYVQRDSRWRSAQLFEFLYAMKPEHLDQVGRALEIRGFNKMDKPDQIHAVCKKLLWESSYIFAYPFKSSQNIDYHSIVVWCASEVGVPAHKGDYTSTFQLEKEIFRQQQGNRIRAIAY